MLHHIQETSSPTLQERRRTCIPQLSPSDDLRRSGESCVPSHFCVDVLQPGTGSVLSLGSIETSMQRRRLDHSVRLDGDRCDASLFISVVPDLTHANTFRFMTETNRTGLRWMELDRNRVIYNGFITIPVCTNIFLETTVPAQ